MLRVRRSAVKRRKGLMGNVVGQHSSQNPDRRKSGTESHASNPDMVPHFVNSESQRPPRASQRIHRDLMKLAWTMSRSHACPVRWDAMEED